MRAGRHRGSSEKIEGRRTSAVGARGDCLIAAPIPESSLEGVEARDDLVLRGVSAALDDEATADRRLAYCRAREREDDCGQEVFRAGTRDRRGVEVNGEEVSRAARPELARGRTDAACAVQCCTLEEPRRERRRVRLA